MSRRVGTGERGGGSKRGTALAFLLAATLVLALVPAAWASSDEGQTDVVGGGPTTIEEWPWQVAIADPPASGGDGQQRQFCGGSLVSPTAVLTAAHCVDGDRGFESPGAFSVITGRTTLSSSSGAEIPVSDLFYFVDVGGTPTTQSVTQPPLGPRLYESRAAFDWDAVILRLSTPAPAPAAPIAIASAAERSIWEAGDPVFATGYGTTFFGSPFGSDTLQEVELDVISDDDCGDDLSYGSSFLRDVMVCAGNPPTGGKDTCQGDSGGPLVAPAGDGTFRLIGDTSFGEGCAVAEKWGVYGRLADSPMCPALIDAITTASGGAAPTTRCGAGSAGPATPPPASPADPANPVSPLIPGSMDRVAPETTLTKKPGKRTRKRRASFEWTATESATFTCRFDKRPTAPCTSPTKRRVRRGKHTFSVTATDAAGNVEAAPERYSWKVRKRKRR